VTSRRAQCGTRVPVGTGLGNLPTSVNVKPNRFLTETHWEGGRVFVQLIENSNQLNADKLAPGVGKIIKTRIVPDPTSSLTSGTGTYERISDGAALAQVGVVFTLWTAVHISRLQRLDCKRCKKDETTRLAKARQNRRANNSQPPLHVAVIVAVT
jgi:hypothetical protein